MGGDKAGRGPSTPCPRLRPRPRPRLHPALALAFVRPFARVRPFILPFGPLLTSGPPKLHSVRCQLVQRGWLAVVHTVPGEQHQRGRGGDVRLQPGIQHHRQRRVAGVHAYGPAAERAPALSVRSCAHTPRARALTRTRSLLGGQLQRHRHSVHSYVNPRSSASSPHPRPPPWPRARPYPPPLPLAHAPTLCSRARRAPTLTHRAESNSVPGGKLKRRHREHMPGVPGEQLQRGRLDHLHL